MVPDEDLQEERRVRRSVYHHAYYLAHLEERRAYQRAYYAARREKKRVYRAEHREETKTRNRAYSMGHREEIRVARGIYRISALLAYGWNCACCDEDQYEFLTIDHIGGGGSKHRREIGSRRLYSWLADHNYPEGFQVLCHNCNMAIGFYGHCPHQEMASAGRMR